MKKDNSIKDPKIHEPIGRITLMEGRYGRAEFLPQVKTGDYIYYKVDDKKILCQVTAMTTNALSGIHGRFNVIAFPAQSPKTWDNLYKAVVTITGQIEVGVTDENEPVRFRLNPFFKHVLIGGKTQKGKTHIQIVMHETLANIKVPILAIDTQNELIYLPEYSKNAVIVEDPTVEEVLELLKQRRTVILTLAGLSIREKQKKVCDLCNGLFLAKENDYKQAAGNMARLKLPPFLIDFDEAEIYAANPKLSKTVDLKCNDAVINLAKRGSKLGIGAIFNVQRLPAFHYDARSQCGSVIAFMISDAGSRVVLAQFPYITPLDLDRTRNFEQGVCLITGELVEYPLVVRVRDIQTKRAKDTDFETQLNIVPTVQLQLQEKETTLIKELEASKAITYTNLEKQFPTREMPNMPQLGKGLIIPEHRFKIGWQNTLEAQGLVVRHFPNLPGGSIYFVGIKTLKRSAALKIKAPQITPAIQVKTSKGVAETPSQLFKNIGPCGTCGLPKSECICSKVLKK